MPGLPISTATTPGAIAMAISGSVPLSLPPEAHAASPHEPAQNTKGSTSLGFKPKENSNISRCASAGGDLFSKVYDFESLYKAWLRARSGKRHQEKTARFSADLEANLICIQNELMYGTWHPGQYEAFEVHEPKRRMIYAPAFRDRIVHHSLYAAMLPICESIFSEKSYACRVGKGTHAGANAAQSLINETEKAHGKCYALKCDIRKYFESIDHSTLKSLIEKTIGCRRTAELCRLIVDTSPAANGVGIPLGNLTSQLFANLYLNELDHFIPRNLAHGYVRYMDDFVIIHNDKSILHELLSSVDRFLSSELKLTLNGKTGIFPVRESGGRALDFLGYRIQANHRRLRQRSLKKGYRYARAYHANPVARNLDQLTSWYAHARHAEPTGMMRKLFAALAGQSKEMN